MRDPGLEIAIKAAGGVASLARGIGIAQPSVSAWSRIPAKRVLAVEALTQVDRFVLRPDLYGSFQNHAIPKPNIDAIDLLNAAGYTAPSQQPDADVRRPFAMLNGHAHVEPASSPRPEGEMPRALVEKLREAVVLELKRQAANDPQSLTVTDLEALVVNGKVDLDRLSAVIARAAFESR